MAIDGASSLMSSLIRRSAAPASPAAPALPQARGNQGQRRGSIVKQQALGLEVWDAPRHELNGLAIAALAVDLRGHGRWRGARG
jgi:hypothetical protein